MQTLLRLLVALLLPSLSASCASVLTTWHDQAYVPVIPTGDALVETDRSPGDVEQVADLGAAADDLYAQGYVLVGYTKFTHTLAPGFQAMYAKMYAGRIGAQRTVQAEPRRNGDVYAYTVTYWAPVGEFPFGAYYNDIPDETALMFPDSLRARIESGHRPVRVETVVAGTPAAEAGVRDGELIVAIDGASFDGTEGLDALVPELAEKEVRVTVWGFEGLRETTCVLGSRRLNASGYGPEGLYYDRPWADAEYRSFEQYSRAFTNAWNASIEASRRAEEQARQDAQVAYLNSEVSSLGARLDGLESRNERSSRQTGLNVDSLRAEGAKNWSKFSSKMDWN